MKQRILQFWLSQIPSCGIEIEEQLDRDWLSAALRESEHDPFHSVGGLVFQGRVQLLGSQDVRVTGRYSFQVRYHCPRCTDTREMEISKEFEHIWIPKEKLQRLGSDDDQEDEAGYSTYENEQIEIEPVLVEELLLSIPMFPVVEEDEDGSCRHCDRRIEEALEIPGSTRKSISPEDVEDQEGEMDPRWAALKKIKL